MDSKTVIVGLCCLFLAIVFFRFKTQVFIWLNPLAKFEFCGTKKLQYTDQDSEPEAPNIDQDSKPEVPNLSWITITGEKFAARFIIFVILSTLIYIVFNSISGVLVQLGNIEFSAGNEKLGLASYKLALEFNWELKKAINQCNAYNTQQKYELAINECGKAIKINKNYISAYTYRGLAYRGLKQYEQAIADFTKVIEIIPVATGAYINRGAAYMEQGKYDLAIAEFTKSIEINPKEPQAYLNRGLSYYQQGKYDSAIIDCNKAIKLEAKYWNAYYCLGVVFANQEKYELAKINFDKAIELAPSNQAVYYYRGSVYFMQNKKELAIVDFTKAIEIDPKYVDAYIGRGNAFADTKRFTEAISDYKKAITITSESKTNSYAYCVQGITYTKMGDFESAIASLEQGVKFDVKNENSWCKSALENAYKGIPTP